MQKLRLVLLPIAKASKKQAKALRAAAETGVVAELEQAESPRISTRIQKMDSPILDSNTQLV